jgi:hypothetical protein
LKAGLAGFGDRSNRIVTGGFPQIAIEATEQIFNLDVPVPVKVMGKTLQRR